MQLNNFNKFGTAIVLSTALLITQGCSNFSATRPSYGGEQPLSGSSPRYYNSQSLSSSPSTSSSDESTSPSNQATPERVDTRTNTTESASLYTASHRYVGTPYKYGGTTTSGFDCSGYVWRVYQDIGLDFSRSSAANYFENGERVQPRNAREGDLVFFKTSGSISHVGIYLADNIFIHSSSSRGVIESSLENSYWKPKIAGFRRYY